VASVTPFVQVGTYPTRNFAHVCCSRIKLMRGTGHFCRSLHVAMQVGLYLHSSRVPGL